MNTLPIVVDAIPDDLRALPQWVCWRDEDGRKMPYAARSGTRASSTDSATWCEFMIALEAYADERNRYSGVGFVFTVDDPYCGVDLDKCIDETGEPMLHAAKVLASLASYCEISPSGRGVKVFVKALKPGDRCKRDNIRWSPEAEPIGGVELYDRERYFTVTGRVLPDTTYTIESRQDQVNELYLKLFPKSPQANVNKPLVDVMDRCRKYLEKCPESISGQGGHDKALRAACECMRFGLSDDQAMEIMRWWSDAKSGGDPWNDREMAHKVKSARDKVQSEGGIGIRLRDEGRIKIGAKMEPQAAEVAEPPQGASAAVADRIAQIRSGRYAAVDWPWRTMSAMSQSLLPGTVTVLCGDPGSGKSFFMLESAIQWLRVGITVAMFELEEDRAYHLQRALAILDEKSQMVDIDWVREHADDAEAAWGCHRLSLDRLGAAIYDAPEQRVSLMQLAEWYESVASTARVVVIDPVTAASASESRWLDDGKFMERVKRIARKSGTSLVLVTHPRIGKKSQITMDDLAGGADYSRFSQTVFVLAQNAKHEPCTCVAPFGHTRVLCNRILHIRKARNGRGGGSDIGFDFSPSSLSFREVGLIVGD